MTLSVLYNLSWGETSFIAKIKLFLKSNQNEKQKVRSGDRRAQAEAYSSLSSTYYSIAGTGFARLKAALRPKWLMMIWLAPLQVLLWCFTWLPLAGWCYLRMLPLSNRMVELIGYEGMSADQCDVRQSILRRRGRYKEAEKCIRVALRKNPEEAHTRGLLHVGLAEVYLRVGREYYLENIAREVSLALSEAEVAERNNPQQASRIYRQCADILDGRLGEEDDSIPSGDQLRLKAKELARATGAQDQLLKLQ